MKILTIAATLLCASCPALYGQFNIFSIDGKTVQVHGFASQGYALSNDNNYLTMQTSKGSFDFTDGGLNVSSSLTDKFRVGAQGYVRSIGQLGGGRFTLDWAFGDYKFKDWFGVRAGKVKTVLGLFNDTQDAESLHTWALLPQAMYPLDLRTALIAHTGGDVYGDVSLRKAGSVSYTAYAGTRPDDRRDGYYFSTQDAGSGITSYTGTLIGMDAHWTTPVAGLMAGGSYVDVKDHGVGIARAEGNLPFAIQEEPHNITAAYAEYVRGHLRLETEFRRIRELTNAKFGPQTTYEFVSDQSDKGLFVSAAWRFNKWLEAGAYNSRYYIDKPTTPEPAANHIFDQTVTVRIDLRQWWDVKIEGHFIDGYGDVYSAHGFYSRSNPDGIKPKTDLLVVRTGFYF